MSAITQVGICNLALTKLGAQTIDAIDEGSVNANHCAAIFDRILEDVLCDHDWGFAQKQVELTDSGDDPEFDYSEEYDKPSDLLKVNYTNTAGARLRVMGDKILSDTASLKIQYTYRNETYASYFPKFVNALATRLAAELAYAITSSRSLAADLKTEYYKKALPQAIAVDSQQGTPIAPQQFEWELSRVRGGGTIAGKTGDETWYPVGEW